MTSGLHEAGVDAERRPRPAGPPAPPRAGTAILLATAASEDGGCAAVLPWEDGTLLGRLLGQLDSLGMRAVHVLARPGFEEGVRAVAARAALPAEVHGSADVPTDLRRVADLADAAPAGESVIVANADILTHREALAGLVSDPRVASGILSSGAKGSHPYANRIRSSRGRVVSAGSAWHYVSRPSGAFLGVLKVAPADRPRLVAQAGRLAPLAAAPPPTWAEELDLKGGRWHNMYARALLGPERAAEAEPEELERMSIEPGQEAERRLRVAAAPEDAVSLLLVGLVRGGVQIGHSYLRKLFWTRPLSRPALEQAAIEIVEYDEDRVLLDSAVKAADGFFTSFFVSPYSRFIARWAAHRGLTPNQVTTVSLVIGVLAAVAFGTGERWGYVAGAILLQAAFTTDCVDGQLARYTRRFSKLGAWLDSVFDRTKEYVVFAGLAIGSGVSGDPVWLLAAGALTLQTVRHGFDFSFGASQRELIGATVHPPLEESYDKVGGKPAPREEPEEPVALVDDRPLRQRLSSGALSTWRQLDRWRGIPWIKRIVVFPIGERFAVISLTAALTTPRTTFTVLLIWGGVAATYSLGGRLLRAFAR